MVGCSSLSKLSNFSSSHPSHVEDPLFENLSISGDVDNDSTFEQRDGYLCDDIARGYRDGSSHEDESSGYGDECSDCTEGFSPASPIDIPTSSRRPHRKSSRLALLAEAWERKRELALQDDLSNLKEEASPHLLGRSSSDCGTARMSKNQHFKRSISDVGKRGCPTLMGTRTRNLRDDDFEELKGCIDLGFCFDETSLSTFGHTLPALEVYCAVAQNLQESPYYPSSTSPARSCCSTPSTPSWRISSPGDTPEEVKERLRHWAQAVACNAKLCY